MEEKRELDLKDMQDVNGGSSNIEWIDHHMMPSTAKKEDTCPKCGFTTANPLDYISHIRSCCGS